MALIPSEQKFHTLDKDTPTKDRGSKQAQALRKIYTMGDISATAAGSIGAPTDIQYETVAVMQAASPDVGKYATTLGYTTVGDGGASMYKIEAADPGGTNHSLLLANGNYAVSQFDGVINPTQWGAILDDKTQATVNATAINAMFAYQEFYASDGIKVEFISGSYYTDSPLLLPVSENLLHIIDFQGSTLYPTLDNMIVLHRPPVNRSGVNKGSESSPVHILNLHIAAYDNTYTTTGCTGIQIQKSYQTVIRGCSFENLEFDIDLQFALQTMVEACLFGSNRNISCYAGVLQDPPGTYHGTKQSNRSVFQNCRWYSSGLGTHCVYVDRSGGVIVSESVFEGTHPLGSEVYLGMGSNTLRDFEIINCHIESGPNTTVGSLKQIFFEQGPNPEGGYYGVCLIKISRLYPQTIAVPISDENPRGDRYLVKMNQGNWISLSSTWWGNSGYPADNAGMGLLAVGGVGSWVFPDEASNHYMGGASKFDLTVPNGGGLPGFIDISPTKIVPGLNINSTATSQDNGYRGYSWRSYGDEDELINQVASSPAQPATSAVQLTLSAWGSSFLKGIKSGQNNDSHFNIGAALTIDSADLYFTDQGYSTDSPSGSSNSPGSIYNHSLGIGGVALTAQTDSILPLVDGTLTSYSTTAVPSTDASPGVQGEIRSDATHTYICVATDDWVRFLNTAAW
jgi:hypothetical protein